MANNAHRKNTCGGGLYTGKRHHVTVPSCGEKTEFAASRRGGRLHAIVCCLMVIGMLVGGGVAVNEKSDHPALAAVGGSRDANAGSTGGRTSSAQNGSAQGVQSVENLKNLAVTQDVSEANGETRKRPTEADIPADAIPANAAAIDGQPAGDFNLAYTGSKATAISLAVAARSAFAAEYVKKHDSTMTVAVQDPYRRTTVSLACTDQGSYVTCEGSAGEKVYIA